jgi:hypothetical protein
MNPNIKPDELSVGEHVLLDAAQAIRDRNKEHGHTERSFSMIAEMWTNYMKHAFTIRGKTELQPHDVAQMMVLLKIARSVYGSAVDNFVDGAGYTALSAMLQPKPAPKKEEDNGSVPT